MLKLGMSVFGSAGAPMFPFDLLSFGAVKRNIGTARAFQMMIESWNMVCARSLLRIHIDTSLRFSAAWLVDEPHEFAMRVLKGERIDKMKDKDGRRLTDAHLVSVHAAEHPWLLDVYKSLSGYVHFSGSHIYGFRLASARLGTGTIFRRGAKSAALNRRRLASNACRASVCGRPMAALSKRHFDLGLRFDQCCAVLVDQSHFYGDH